MKNKVRFLGLDVHAETIAVAIAEPDGEVRSLGTIANRAESVCKLVKKLGPAEHLKACYEAGPTGYVLYWQLAELGVACEVIAPSPCACATTRLLSRSPGRAKDRPPGVTQGRTEWCRSDVPCARPNRRCQERAETAMSRRIWISAAVAAAAWSHGPTAPYGAPAAIPPRRPKPA